MHSQERIKRAGSGRRIRLIKFCFLITVFSISQLVTPSTYAASSTLPSGIQQEKTIAGSVSDEEGNPLPGVNIVIRGTNEGTITDIRGGFTLTVPDDGILVFTYIGYEQQEVAVAGKTEIYITLLRSVSDIDEVVVMGYSTKTRTEISSAVDELNADELTDVTAADIGSMLQGKVAGLQVVNSSGAPGSVAEIRVRGVSTIKPGNNDPLFVVDGIIGGSFDPNDVESITVLKDAGATGMYGARANKGVIIVTTKTGKSGKTQIDFKSSIGYRIADQGNLSMMNSEEFYETSRELYRDRQTYEIDTAKFLQIYPAELLDRDFDWVGEAFNPALTQNYYLSASGGSEKFSHIISASYFNEEGTFQNTDYERLNLRINTKYKLTERISLVNNININGSRQNYYGWEDINNIYSMVPWDYPYNDDGTIRFVDGSDADWWYREKVNPLHSMDNADRLRKGGSVNYDLVFTYNISKWLAFSSSNRIGVSTSKDHEYISPLVGRTYYGKGFINESQDLVYGGISTNLFRFNFNLNDHSISGLVGGEFDVDLYENMMVQGTGLPEGFQVPSVASSEIEIDGSNSKEVFQSFLSQVNYNYNKRYFLTASYRIDATSNFPPNRRIAHFPTVAASWLISNESFLRNSDVLTLLRLRASYGLTGDPDIGASRFLGLFNLNTQYSNTVAAYPSQLPNENLSWERTHERNLGLNLGLFNRVELTMDFYNNLTKDLIVLIAQPLSMGFEYRWGNAGEVLNTGIEMTFSSVNIRTSSFEWSTDLIFAYNYNELAEISQPFYRTRQGVSQIYRTGIPIYTFVLPKWLGIDEETGAPLYEHVEYDEAGNVLTREPTTFYKDATPQEVGNALPKFQGGFRTSFSIGNFSLFATMAYQYGNDIYNMTRIDMDHDGHEPYINYMKPHEDWSRWTQPGDDATHPFMQNARVSTAPSSRYIEDGAFIKLRNVALRYDFPTSFLSRIKLQGLAISLKADNLYTFTDFWGQDPEVTMNNTNWAMPGVTSYKYPNNKQFIVNIEVKF